jgi:hypothetical protein
MNVLLAVLALVVLLFILGAAGVADLLLWVAVILLAIWVVGFFVRMAEGARWYRW